MSISRAKGLMHIAQKVYNWKPDEAWRVHRHTVFWNETRT